LLFFSEISTIQKLVEEEKIAAFLGLQNIGASCKNADHSITIYWRVVSSAALHYFCCLDISWTRF